MTLSGLYFKKVLQAGKISGQTHWDTPTGPGQRVLPWNRRMFLAQGRGQWQQRPKGQRVPEPLGKSHPAWLESQV